MQVSIQIPDDLLLHLVPSGQDAARSILEDSVAEAYREKRLTLNQVCRLLGLGTRLEADEFLSKRQIYDDYTVDDFEREVATLCKSRAEPKLQPAS